MLTEAAGSVKSAASADAATATMLPRHDAASAMLPRPLTGHGA
jgi:hypothetical protein